MLIPRLEIKYPTAPAPRSQNEKSKAGLNGQRQCSLGLLEAEPSAAWVAVHS
jgi:hypothetical protein